MGRGYEGVGRGVSGGLLGGEAIKVGGGEGGRRAVGGVAQGGVRVFGTVIVTRSYVASAYGRYIFILLFFFVRFPPFFWYRHRDQIECSVSVRQRRLPVEVADG